MALGIKVVGLARLAACSQSAERSHALEHPFPEKEIRDSIVNPTSFPTKQHESSWQQSQNSRSRLRRYSSL